MTDSGEVWYNSSSDIAGLQFEVDGATVNSVSGGDATAAGFTLSSGSTTVLGFSFSGAFIPAGCGTLLELDLTNPATSLSGIVLSDSSGQDLNFSYYDGNTGGVELCEDQNACNFGQEGDCQFAEENFDCDGNCIVAVDCNGECGGTAELDVCGVLSLIHI